MRARGAVAALAVVALLAFGGWHLWRRATLIVPPAVVFPDTDVAAVWEPSLRARVARALTGARPADPAQRSRLIALTFDDGPYPVDTPLLLAQLRALHVPATFFLIGRDGEQFPDLVRAIAADGHELADHTLTHPDLDKLPDGDVAHEIEAGAASLGTIAPSPSLRRLFRPPHGRFTSATLHVAQRLGYETILWTDDPGDWRSLSAAALTRHVLARATVPEILLLHSGRPETVAMLPEAVARLRAEGYAFVTVSDLIRRAGPEQLRLPARRPLAL